MPNRRCVITGAETDRLTADQSVQHEVRGLAAEDGVETRFAVHHLAPILLTHLLLDRLRPGAPAWTEHIRGSVDGLSIGGAAGVQRVVEMLRDEFEMAMQITGRSTLRELDPPVRWSPPA